jgi:hypothetical protein
LSSNYIHEIERGAIVAPRIQFAYREHLYCRVGNLYGSGHPPDSLVAGTLAAVKYGSHQRWLPIVGTVQWDGNDDAFTPLTDLRPEPHQVDPTRWLTGSHTRGVRDVPFAKVSCKKACARSSTFLFRMWA